jgi:hypothetical protein
LQSGNFFLPQLGQPPLAALASEKQMHEESPASEEPLVLLQVEADQAARGILNYNPPPKANKININKWEHTMILVDYDTWKW